MELFEYKKIDKNDFSLSTPFPHIELNNYRTSIGQLYDYKLRKIGEFGLGYYLNKIVRKIIK